jgi:putative peptidoglycan lipid II flippase
MLNKIFYRQINSVTIAAILIGGTSLISRLLGVFRDRILAGEFGAGDTLDIYYTAFRIPDFIFNIIVLGALSAGFVPIISQLINKGKNEEAWKLSSNIINILSLFIIFLSIFGVIFSNQLIKFIAPGFDQEKIKATAEITRIMFLSPLFLGLSGVFSGILQSFKRFFVYSIAPIFYNIGIIIGALYLAPSLGVKGLAWGVILGSFFHAAVQLPVLFKLGFKYQLIFNWKDDLVKKIKEMTVARTFALAIGQLNLLVITIIASTLTSGSITVFNLANNLQYFPVSIFGISYAMAVFPVLSIYASNNEKLAEKISKTVRQILFFIIPSTILIIALRAQIVRVVLGSGKFDWNDTLMTMDALSLFAVSFFAQALIPLFNRAFYARENSKTPLYIALFSVIINIILSFIFAKKLSVSGLALAFSISSIVNFALLFLCLKIEIKTLDEKNILLSIAKFTLAAIISAITIQGVKLLIHPYVDMNKFYGVLTQGLSAGLLGIVAYLGVCALLKSQELDDFWQGLKKRFKTKNKAEINTENYKETTNL